LIANKSVANKLSDCGIAKENITVGADHRRAGFLAESVSITLHSCYEGPGHGVHGFIQQFRHNHSFLFVSAVACAAQNA
jgi:hypothetical protein